MYFVPEYRPVDRASMQCMQNAILLWHFCLSVRPSVCSLCVNELTYRQKCLTTWGHHSSFSSLYAVKTLLGEPPYSGGVKYTGLKILAKITIYPETVRDRPIVYYGTLIGSRRWPCRFR